MGRTIPLWILGRLLVVEAVINGLHVAGLIHVLQAHDATAIALIFARGAVAALEFTTGWTLSARRPSSLAMAQLALAAAAVVTTLDVGFNLAPTEIYPWWRWQVVGAYAVYALAAISFLQVVKTRA